MSGKLTIAFIEFEINQTCGECQADAAVKCVACRIYYCNSCEKIKHRQSKKHKKQKVIRFNCKSNEYELLCWLHFKINNDFLSWYGHKVCDKCAKFKCELWCKDCRLHMCTYCSQEVHLTMNAIEDASVHIIFAIQGRQPNVVQYQFSFFS